MVEASHGVAGRPSDTELQERRRREILLAAIDLFARKGFQRTEVQEIADAAGVAKGTVYRYFESKEALFLAAADLSMRELAESIDRVVDEIKDPVQRLRKAALTVAGYFERYPERIELLAQERAEFRGSIPPTHLIYREQRRPRFEATLREAIAQGALRPVNVRALADALSYLLFGVILCGSVEHSPKKLKQLVRETIDAVLSLLQPAEEAGADE